MTDNIMCDINEDGNTKASNSSKYLSFDLGTKAYGIPIEHVKEIMEYREVEHVPKMPEYVIGAINLRGSIISVIDWSRLLGGEYQETTNRTCIVVIEVNIGDIEVEVGVRVDSIRQVFNLRDDCIDRAPSLGGQIPTDFIYGIGKTEGNFIVLLNLENILSVETIETALSLRNPDISNDITVE